MFQALLDRLRPFADVFAAHGTSVYLVGGALRNLHLGLEVKDFDFATDASPKQVMSYFRKVIPTGLQHGTVTVLFGGNSYEVTTFRVDGEYLDHRRPENVQFSTDLAEDLKRRDFTINALALDLVTGALVDHHSGVADLRARVLRAIGEPSQRFSEDALRILRLFRFSAQLDFSIEERTLRAALEAKTTVDRVSRERVRDELIKTLGSRWPENAWPVLEREGLLLSAFTPLRPEPLPSEVYVQWKALTALARVAVFLAVGCRGQASLWEAGLRQLKFSNKEIRDVLLPLEALQRWNQSGTPVTRAKACVALWENRERALASLPLLRALANLGELDADAPEQMDGACRSPAPIYLAELAVTGKDLLDAGAPAGERLGRILRALQARVWEFPEDNVKTRLLERWKDVP